MTSMKLEDKTSKKSEDKETIYNLYRCPLCGRNTKLHFPNLKFNDAGLLQEIQCPITKITKKIEDKDMQEYCKRLLDINTCLICNGCKKQIKKDFNDKNINKKENDNKKEHLFYKSKNISLEKLYIYNNNLYCKECISNVVENVQSSDEDDEDSSEKKDKFENYTFQKYFTYCSEHNNSNSNYCNKHNVYLCSDCKHDCKEIIPLNTIYPEQNKKELADKLKYINQLKEKIQEKVNEFNKQLENTKKKIDDILKNSQEKINNFSKIAIENLKIYESTLKTYKSMKNNICIAKNAKESWDHLNYFGNFIVNYKINFELLNNEQNKNEEIQNDTIELEVEVFKQDKPPIKYYQDNNIIKAKAEKDGKANKNRSNNNEPLAIDDKSVKANLGEKIFFICDTTNNEHGVSYDYLNKSNTKMIVDGAINDFSKYWIFQTEGKHTVKYVIDVSKIDMDYMDGDLTGKNNQKISLANINNNDESKSTINTLDSTAADSKDSGSVNVSNNPANQTKIKKKEKNNKISLANMFFNCYYIKKANLSEINSNIKVEDAHGMFYNNYSLKEIQFGKGLNFKKVCDFSGAFCNCYQIEKIDLKFFSLKKVTHCAFTFSNCFNLRKVDLTNASLSKIIDYENMFLNCLNLEHFYCDIFAKKRLEYILTETVQNFNYDNK